MQFYEINICQVIILRLTTVYNNYEMIKISNQTRQKSQVLNNFAADCSTLSLEAFVHVTPQISNLRHYKEALL